MTDMRAGFVKIAALAGAILLEPGHAQTTQNKGNTEWKILEANTEWLVFGDGSGISGHGPQIVGHARTGEVIHRVVFDCVTAPGGWWPSRWNGFKKLTMSVISVDPAAHCVTSHNIEGPITVATSAGTFDMPPEYTLRDDTTHIMAATVTVSDPVIDVLRREATLHVRFGDAASSFAFAYDIASGRQKILDYANGCK